MTSAPRQNRVEGLDALRGLAIIAMILSGQLPFDRFALPAWMYHAQEPPPSFQFDGNLPGITWVDLVFPFFLFSMGAAFPLALNRRVEAGEPRGKMVLMILERGLLLGFFALFVQLIRPYTISNHPTTGVLLQALLGFLILFPILTRLPAAWPKAVKLGIRSTGWLGAILFCWLTVYPNGSGFSLGRSDIIIVVLANMAVFGALAWLFTRQNLILRLGILGLVFAVRMSNLPSPTDGWVHDLWQWSPVPWMYRLYYLQYLCVVIPGTIAGDILLQWAQKPREENSSLKRSGIFYSITCLLMATMVVVTVCGMKARWLLSTVLIDFALLAAGFWLLSKPLNVIETTYKRLFQWAAYWLVLGLVFEPYEGGIKKDHPTMSYYFVCSGLAICAFIALSILIDIFRQRRLFGLLLDNGQNPMIAYAGINNFTIPVLQLTGATVLLDRMVTSPWLGFWRGLFITLVTVVMVSLLTRRKIFWRT